MADHPTPIKFGILCNDSHLQRWQADAVRQLLALENVTLNLVIRNVTLQPPSSKGVFEKLSLLGWKIYSRRINRLSEENKRVSMASLYDGIPLMNCEVESQGAYSEVFSEEDIQGIRSHKLDFLLRFGFNIIRGDILNAAKFGVWSFHHGDEMKYRGLPAGFWENYHGEAATGAIMQRLVDRLDGGIVLEKGHLKTDLGSYVRTRDRLYRESSAWPAHVCKRIQLLGEEAVPTTVSNTNAKIYTNPTNSVMVSYLIKRTWRWMKKLIRTLFYVPYWNVGLVDQPIESVMEGIPKVDWLEGAKPSGYRADPFGWVSGGSRYLLFEALDYTNNKGCIEGLTLGSDAIEQVIAGHHHLSYPFLLEDNGQLYCIPELSQRGEVVLFRNTGGPHTWEESQVLIPNFAGGDCSVINHEGRWWMFCVDAEDGPNEKLQLWFADQLQGTWTPHPLNPVKTDIRSARPAGTPYFANGSWFRPGQDSSRSYGGGIAINKILTLTTKDYREETVGFVTPDPKGAYPAGMHTLSRFGDQCLVDGMKWISVFSGMAVLRYKWRSLLNRGANH